MRAIVAFILFVSGPWVIPAVAAPEFADIGCQQADDISNCARFTINVVKTKNECQASFTIRRQDLLNWTGRTDPTDADFANSQPMADYGQHSVDCCKSLLDDENSYAASNQWNNARGVWNAVCRQVKLERAAVASGQSISTIQSASCDSILSIYETGRFPVDGLRNLRDKLGIQKSEFGKIEADALLGRITVCANSAADRELKRRFLQLKASASGLFNPQGRDDLGIEAVENVRREKALEAQLPAQADEMYRVMVQEPDGSRLRAAFAAFPDEKRRDLIEGRRARYEYHRGTETIFVPVFISEIRKSIHYIEVDPSSIPPQVGQIIDAESDAEKLRKAYLFLEPAQKRDLVEDSLLEKNASYAVTSRLRAFLREREAEESRAVAREAAAKERAVANVKEKARAARQKEVIDNDKNCQEWKSMGDWLNIVDKLHKEARNEIMKGQLDEDTCKKLTEAELKMRRFTELHSACNAALKQSIPDMRLPGNSGALDSLISMEAMLINQIHNTGSGQCW